jgi:uncharacterized membrane protein
MPNLASYHPQIVHFVVSLLMVGVALRVISLIGRPKFVNPAAAMLILIGTAAAVLAVKSGTDAHGPVERIPGTRALVIEHEEAGQLTRNIFLGVAALELLVLGLSLKPTTVRFVRIAQAASALLGLYGVIELNDAAGHGGELVYNYAGGPGLRSGNPKDVEHLLLAGLYNQSQADRKAGRSAQSASLVDEMARRFPGDTTVRFLHVESLLLDRKDYAAALAAVDSISVAPTDARLRPRQATLKADIYLAMGKPDSARAVLTPVIAAFPQSTRLKAKLDSIR